MWQNMKSVMVFDPKESDEQTANHFIDWMRDNKSIVADKAVPGAKETNKILWGNK